MLANARCCAGWGPGQLEEEVRRGVWFPAAASSAFVLQQQPPGQPAAGVEAMWHQILQLMGGEYAELSAAMREAYRADIMELKEPTEDSP